MATNNWRISSASGVLLACYFIPTWIIIAFRIMVSPIHSFYERPNVSLAFFLSDYLQLAATGTVRAAWLLALGRVTVAAFFAIFLVLVFRSKIRKFGGSDEALSIALGIGSVISFALMLMASKVGEVQALRLHATELLVMLGTVVALAIEGSVRARIAESATNGETLSLRARQFLNHG
jgi:cytochrome bd-type quinol oxidase subunit 1